MDARLMPPEKLPDDTERAEVTARIERYKRMLGSFTDQRVLRALRESIADLEAQLDAEVIARTEKGGRGTEV